MYSMSIHLFLNHMKNCTSVWVCKVPKGKFRILSKLTLTEWSSSEKSVNIFVIRIWGADSLVRERKDVLHWLLCGGNTANPPTSLLYSTGTWIPPPPPTPLLYSTGTWIPPTSLLLSSIVQVLGYLSLPT